MVGIYCWHPQPNLWTSGSSGTRQAQVRDRLSLADEHLNKKLYVIQYFSHIFARTDLSLRCKSNFSREIYKINIKMLFRGLRTDRALASLLLLNNAARDSATKRAFLAKANYRRRRSKKPFIFSRISILALRRGDHGICRQSSVLRQKTSIKTNVIAIETIRSPQRSFTEVASPRHGQPPSSSGRFRNA